MPELPEVQTITSQIKPAVVNKRIIDIRIFKSGERLISPMAVSEFQRAVINRQIVDLTRHGKFFTFKLDDGKQMVGHLRMTGLLTISKTDFQSSHLRIRFTLSDSTFLNFIDIRRFATLQLIEPGEIHHGLSRLGPDALNTDFNTSYFHQKLQNRNKSIYSCLLDQAIVAGIGNIYANEILFAAKIHPLCPAGQISVKEAAIIVENTKRILTMAINFRGTTLIDKTYRDSQDNFGKFFTRLNVYSQAGKKCKNCTNLISKIRINNRSVYFCAGCQQQ